MSTFCTVGLGRLVCGCDASLGAFLVDAERDDVALSGLVVASGGLDGSVVTSSCVADGLMRFLAAEFRI
jgi:hypothetical protein